MADQDPEQYDQYYYCYYIITHLFQPIPSFYVFKQVVAFDIRPCK